VCEPLPRNKRTVLLEDQAHLKVNRFSLLKALGLNVQPEGRCEVLATTCMWFNREEEKEEEFSPFSGGRIHPVPFLSLPLPIAQNLMMP